MDQNAHAWLGVIESNFNGEALGIHRPAPIIGRDGNEVWVLKKRNECSQNTILSAGGEKKKRADKETRPKKVDTRHRQNSKPSQKMVSSIHENFSLPKLCP